MDKLIRDIVLKRKPNYLSLGQITDTSDIGTYTVQPTNTMAPQSNVNYITNDYQYSKGDNIITISAFNDPNNKTIMGFT